MPVKGLTDQVKLPRVGKIHLGVLAPNKKGPGTHPVATDYFVVHKCDATSQEMVDAFKAKYGETPRELNFMFPTEEPLQFLDTWNKRYGKGSGLLCKGDGETAQEINEQGKYTPVACNCPFLTKSVPPSEFEAFKEKWGKDAFRLSEKGNLLKNSDGNILVVNKCRTVTNFFILLPDLPGLGVWQVDTGSSNSVINIQSAIAMLKGAVGKCSGIPLKLVLKKEDTQVDGKKKVIYVLNVPTNNFKLSDLLEKKSVAALAQDDAEPVEPGEEAVPEGAVEVVPEPAPAPEPDLSLDSAEVAPDEEEEAVIDVAAEPTPEPAPPPATKETTKPAAKPAAKAAAKPAPEARPVENIPPSQRTEAIVIKEIKTDADKKCEHCASVRELRIGAVKTENPTTGKPYGRVEALVCAKCNKMEVVKDLPELEPAPA